MMRAFCIHARIPARLAARTATSRWLIRSIFTWARERTLGQSPEKLYSTEATKVRGVIMLALLSVRPCEAVRGFPHSREEPIWTSPFASRRKRTDWSTGILAGGIAHDFNNLLAGLLMNYAGIFAARLQGRADQAV